MSDNSEMVDAEETPLAAVIDDSCTLQYIEITPLDRPSDDCYKQECVDPVVEVKLEDLPDVKQLLMKLIIQPSSQRHYRVIEHLTIALSGCLLLLIATSWEVLNQLLKSSQKTYKM